MVDARRALPAAPVLRAAGSASVGLYARPVRYVRRKGRARSVAGCARCVRRRSERGIAGRRDSWGESGCLHEVRSTGSPPARGAGTPTPQKNEVRSRIVATAVTSSDCYVRGLNLSFVYRIMARLALGWTAPRCRVLGMVLSGEVDSVGPDVRSFKVGDEVFGFNRHRFGAYADYVCWPEDGLLATRPANLTNEEAAAIPYGGLLALHFLRRANVKAGQRVLIYGASGAVGTSAVQLARHFGAEVTGVCSTANLEQRVGECCGNAEQACVCGPHSSPRDLRKSPISPLPACISVVHGPTREPTEQMKAAIPLHTGVLLWKWGELLLLVHLSAASSPGCSQCHENHPRTLRSTLSGSSLG